MLALALTGCKTEPGGGTAAVPGAAAGTTTNSGTLRWVMNTEPTSLDPAKLTDVNTYEMLENCFEGLVRTNAQSRIEPALAEKWEISPDGKTYTFHLRKGVTFHDGTPLTADDVKYSWERTLLPKTASPVAPNYLDGILGVKEMAARTRQDLPGVVVVDAQTLKITIDRPRSYFLGMLTYPTGWVVCKAAITKNGDVVDEKALIGTGPFVLESYQPGKQVAFKANPHYWGGKPKLARLEFPVMLNPETMYSNFETGQVDVTFGTSARCYQDKQAGKFSAEYQLVPSANVTYLTMQPKKQPVFAKREVRQAFARAIDRSQILQVAYKGIGRLANGFVPPQLPDCGPEPPPIPYDPAKAKQLLAQAGYPNGAGFPTLTLTYQQQLPEASATAEIIRNNLRENLNITVNLQEREFGQLIDETNHEAVEFYIANWVADYPDPQDFLSTLLVSNAPYNHFGYSNPRFDALCAQADQERDDAKRAQLYGEANRILMEDVGLLPLNHAPRIYMIHTNIQGWSASLCNFLPLAQVTKTAR